MPGLLQHRAQVHRPQHWRHKLLGLHRIVVLLQPTLAGNHMLHCQRGHLLRRKGRHPQLQRLPKLLPARLEHQRRAVPEHRPVWVQVPASQRRRERVQPERMRHLLRPVLRPVQGLHRQPGLALRRRLRPVKQGSSRLLLAAPRLHTIPRSRASLLLDPGPPRPRMPIPSVPPTHPPYHHELRKPHCPRISAVPPVSFQILIDCLPHPRACKRLLCSMYFALTPLIEKYGACSEGRQGSSPRGLCSWLPAS